jgi:hypothetical protein
MECHQILTIGHSTIGFTKKSARTFFTKLRESGAQQVVDVRLNNVSQLAGFGKRDDLQFFLRETICVAGCIRGNTSRTARRWPFDTLAVHGNFAYSARASLMTGIPASASFHTRSRSSYEAFALPTSPAIVQALASCSRARAPIGSSSTMPGWSRILRNSAAASAGLRSARYAMPRT